MFSYHLKIAIRNIWKNKLIHLVNVIGFSIAISACIILVLWIKKQYEYNSFLVGDKNVFQVFTSYEVNNDRQTVGGTSFPIYRKIKESIPEVSKIVFARYEPKDYHISFNDREVDVKAIAGSEDFFQVFSLNFLAGDEKINFDDPLSIVISESLARNIFGSDWRIKFQDEPLVINGWKQLDVAGVFADIPKESTERFDCFVPLETPTQENIGSFDYLCFAEVVGDSHVEVEGKVNKLIASDMRFEIKLHNFRDAYLYSNFVDGNAAGGRITYVKLFVLASILVLSLACLNFANLYLSTSVLRVKELGLRRVIGENRVGQIRQLALEAVLISFLSMFLAVIISYITLPFFGKSLGFEISMPIATLDFWLFIVTITIFIGLLSGAYPSLLLTSLNPIDALSGKGNFKLTNAGSRKVFFVFQFCISALLVLFAYGVGRQINFVNKKDLGFEKSNVLCYTLPAGVKQKINTFKVELAKESAFSDISLCSTDLLGGAPMVGGLQWPKKDPTDSSEFGVLFTDNNFVKTMRVPIVDGNFSTQNTSNEDVVSVVINRKASEKMGGSILGQQIQVWGQEAIVVGIINDFHFNTLFNPIQPLIIANMPMESEFLLARVFPGRQQDAINALTNMHKKMEPRSTLNYFWLDERIKAAYEDDTRMSQVSKAFSFLSLLISCLGFFALTSFAIEKRMKEFSIRQLLGADFWRVTKHLCWEFFLPSAISILIALPIALYFLEEWQKRFTYTESLLDLSYLAVISGMLLIVLLTVIYQAVKVVRTAPVKYLRQ